MLGKGHGVLLRRAELKTFVNFHGNEVSSELRNMSISDVFAMTLQLKTEAVSTGVSLRANFSDRLLFIILVY